MRYWNVERLMGDTWLATDWEVSGTTEADALARATQILGDRLTYGWEGVRLGRELDGTERHRYCSLAWINAN